MSEQAGHPGTQGGAPGKDGSGGVGGVGGEGGTGRQGIPGADGADGASVHRLGLLLTGFAVVFAALVIGIGFGLWQQYRAIDTAEKAVAAAQAEVRVARVVSRDICLAREKQIDIIVAKDAKLAELEKHNAPDKVHGGGGKPEIRAGRIAAYDAEKAALLKSLVDCSKLLPGVKP